METINYVLGYENIKIIQESDSFRFSIDSILLPNFVTINKNIKKILDIGTGNAPMPLILSTKTKAQITGIEIQKKSAELARKSVALNNLENQIQIIQDDIRSYPLETDQYDVITCNPPFFKVCKNSHFNEKDEKTIARHEVTLTLEDVLTLARKLLKNQGVVALVHRPERLVDILVEMRKNNIEPKKIQYVYPKKNENSHILLIEGKKNGNSGLKILPPLYVHHQDGSYTEEVKKYFS